ncbi:MAG: hypothetical protein N3B18_04570 [Desulfobacterota bacterium]|nr:hypothetical protein [Thermodesulfobacteriota bacterium]
MANRKQKQPGTQPLLPESELQRPEVRKPGRPRKTPEECDKKFTLQLPRDVHRALKVKSAELDMPMAAMIIDAIRKVYNI